MDLVIVSVFFWGLTCLSLRSRKERQRLRKRSSDDWLVDGISLVIQGALIPLLQKGIGVVVLTHWWPHLKGSLHLGGIGCFLLNFALVDYIYYWNHRWLHSPRLWFIHRLHHSSKDLDLYGTSRNSWFSSFFVVYFWLNTFFIYWVDVPSAYILSMALTAGMDLWRHTGFRNQRLDSIYKRMSWIFITPYQHQWHHGQKAENLNFGANLSLWDQLHGTYRGSLEAPKAFGLQESLKLTREFLFPTR